MVQSKIFFTSTFFVLWACIFPITSSYDPDNLYIIQNKDSGLVLQAGNLDDNVSMAVYDGLPSQLWKFESASRPGLLYIVSSENNGVLDLAPASIEDNKYYISVRTKGRSVYQEWFIDYYNETVFNNRLKLVICQGGDPVHLDTPNSVPARVFLIEDYPNQNKIK